MDLTEKTYYVGATRLATFLPGFREETMFQSMTALANGIVHYSLGLYYDCAAHRTLDTDALDVADDQRPLIFFRGMLHFEPSDPYFEELRNQGFSPSVFRFSPEAERNHLRQWPENTVDIIRGLLDDPELLEHRPIFAGHSAGGFSAYVLAAMAKGAN